VPEGCVGIVAPLSGTIVTIEVDAGVAVRKGQALVVVEAMKMEHVVAAPAAGTVRSIGVVAGDTTAEADVLMILDPADDSASQSGPVDAVASTKPRADLEELARRRAMTLDDARPDAVAKRRKIGARTARENIEDLCDPGSFQEYGAFVIAAQRNRRTLDDLIARTPADGMVMGVGRINGHLFPDTEARAAILSYDYTVLAGTQGTKNHEKKDRLFELTAQWRLPIVLFAEGGGGRPGDIDTTMAGSLHIKAFTLLAQLSGLVPMVGIVSGRCFAGNAVVAGCCDVIIATENASLGMGGPAMIEGGGLGTFAPDEVGPTSVQRRNGVIDVVVPDEAAAVRVAKQYLSYFQGAVTHWACADQKALRHLIPENRLRAYDVRRIIDTLADTDSVLELRRDFAGNMVTAFIRVEGRPLGLLANNAMVLGGAIDANAADKAARFLQLCDAHDIPVLSLCDTPGNMVGPEAERTALVRHCCRLYVTGANLSVPILSIVLRKAYGLGAQGMVGGSFHLPLFSVAWPTGEFGPMNLEGAVRLGYRKELEAIADPVEREAKFAEMVATSYERGKALSAAALFEIDDVIDPAETRAWIVSGLRSLPQLPARQGKKRPFVDTW
jgi:acetyl-CoA carboxylase carboxyltransferase component